MLRIGTGQHNKIVIPTTFNDRIKDKYNSDLRVEPGKLGFIVFNDKQRGALYQEDITTDMRVSEISKILLELSSEYDEPLTGSFNFTSFFINGDNQGTAFLLKDKVIIYSFEVDNERYSEVDVNNGPHKEIITL